MTLPNNSVDAKKCIIKAQKCLLTCCCKITLFKSGQIFVLICKVNILGDPAPKRYLLSLHGVS